MFSSTSANSTASAGDRAESLGVPSNVRFGSLADIGEGYQGCPLCLPKADMFIVEIDVFAEGQGRRHVSNHVTDEIAIAVDWSAAEGWNLPSPTPPDMGSMLSKTSRRTARGQQSKWPPWPRPSSPLYNYHTIAPRGFNALSQSEAGRPSRQMGSCPRRSSP